MLGSNSTSAGSFVALKSLTECRPMTNEPNKPTSEGSSSDGTPALFQLAYDTLHSLAAAYLRRERPDHTLQPTALLHEAFMKIQHAEWQSDAHFKATAASAMRQVLVDHARGRGRQKRGGQWKRVMLRPDVAGEERGIDLIALDEAMEQLKELNERKAQVVELRFFGGMTLKEVGEHLGISPKTAEADWYFARAWLRDRLDKTEE